MKKLDADEMIQLWYQIGMIVQAAVAVPLDELAALEDANSHGQAIGPVVDPTRFRNDMEVISNNADLLRIFARFRRDVGPIYEREMARVGRRPNPVA